ncbi:MAG: type IVB secretion system protein IcmJDotN [Gammaproteobacteria bacterium]|nr:type IVB secretion system protein IcmJDotN [Gammaproteobacteria bacterium]MCW5582575.1 type IVB secretion system protein IcmJDotN [Gammaproteobacteria bacterium]
MHNLLLAVNLSGWRAFVRRKEDKGFLPAQKRVFGRDQYTCQYCGFQAKEYQEVVNLDGNYANNKLSNMITACCFCSQCLFLQSVGIDEMGGGQLIYLPEISQRDLNSFCHVLFCAMENNTGYQDSAQSIYRSLKFRSQIVENKFGSGTSNPAIMGQMIIEYRTQAPKKKVDILKDMRLLPSHVKFKVQLDAWAAAALQELEAEQQSTKSE